MEKTNNIKIVGRLASCDLKTNRRKDNGQGYISGNVIINSVIGGETKEFEVSFYANELSQTKQPSKLYISYSKLNELVGKKVEITGSLSERRYWSTKTKQLTSLIQLTGRFVRGVSETTEDMATFEVGGFVVSPLVEKTNKEGEIYRYDVQIGQSNYSDNMINLFTFNVKPTDIEIINGLKKMYNVGDTVRLNGEIDHRVTTVTKTEDVGFGSGNTRTFTNRSKQYWVCGGSAVITDPELKYGEALIRDLISAYKARDVEIAAKAEDKPEAETEEKPAVTHRQASLI